MDEAIGAEFNGFEWVQVQATGLAKPNVPGAWFAAHTVDAHGDRVAMCWEGERTWQERCTRRCNLTVDASTESWVPVTRNCS